MSLHNIPVNRTKSEPDFISSAGLRRVTLADARVRPTLDFVLPGLLAGTTGLIVAPGGAGKTMFGLALGLAVASGRPVCQGLWPAGPVGPVTIVAGEDPPEILQERLHHLRIAEGLTEEDDDQLDEGLLTILSGVEADLRILTTLTTAEGRVVEGPFFPALRLICQGQRLVILDPLLFLSDCDENDNGRMGQLMRLLNRLAAETGAAIVLLHHVGKSAGGAGDDWTAARGASSLTTSVRWQINLQPLPSLLGKGKTPQEKEINAEVAALGFNGTDPHYWVRVAVTKSNYAPLAEPSWLRRAQGGILRLIRRMVSANPDPSGAGDQQPPLGRNAARVERLGAKAKKKGASYESI